LGRRHRQEEHEGQEGEIKDEISAAPFMFVMSLLSKLG
jgi:hypothetical protein